MKDRIIKYLGSDVHLWWTVTVLPGIYCILYLYTNNFTVVNSWYQLLWCALAFILLPVVEILVLDAVFKKWLPKWRPQLYWSYLIINFAIILSMIVFMEWRWKYTALAAVVAIASSILMARHYKKGVLLLAFMTVIAVYQFTHFYIERVASPEQWVENMPFENLNFKKKPNIYLIQPDGFVGKTAAESSNYNLDLTSFYSYLSEHGFVTNDDYRSNYASTLTSNSALFTGQHHYYLNGAMESELYGARETIVGANPVIRTFKRNGYHTNLILEHAYLLLNFPEVAYDYSNVKSSELSVPIPDYQLDKDFIADFKKAVRTQSSQPQFYFLEMLRPGHIEVYEKWSAGKRQEAADYGEKLIATTILLNDLIEFIGQQDPDGIILLVADHGGFAGFDYTQEIFELTVEDPDLKKSMYSSLLSVKAPADFIAYQRKIKSSVGVFPALFSYLAGDSAASDRLDNSSYIFIKKGDARGVYTYFNSNGEPVTEKLPD